mmetsp:Transcript_14850/g.37739  ORF Transcript_14850/g.37739 Transcript_14850/m.37739 type:complete len:303 (+) Transcript_14850:339-1247(+)
MDWTCAFMERLSLLITICPSTTCTCGAMAMLPAGLLVDGSIGKSVGLEPPAAAEPVAGLLESCFCPAPPSAPGSVAPSSLLGRFFTGLRSVRIDFRIISLMVIDASGLSWASLSVVLLFTTSRPESRLFICRAAFFADFSTTEARRPFSSVSAALPRLEDLGVATTRAELLGGSPRCAFFLLSVALGLAGLATLVALEAAGALASTLDWEGNVAALVDARVLLTCLTSCSCAAAPAFPELDEEPMLAFKSTLAFVLLPTSWLPFAPSCAVFALFFAAGTSPPETLPFLPLVVVVVVVVVADW